MTSPSSHYLPGNGFSVWTQQPTASHSLQLVSATLPEESASDHDPAATDPAGTPSESSGGGSGSQSHDNYPAPRRGGGFLKWAALFLFLCALAAYLSSEHNRKKVVAERDGLQSDKETLIIEKQGLHDNWTAEQERTANLTEEIGDLENSLSASRKNVVQLNTEKISLGKVIDELQSSLTMAINDHRNTKASLEKVIEGLEAKNAQLTSTLAKEREKLKDLDLRLSKVTNQLSATKVKNEELSNENTVLQDKVAQLQSALDQTVKEATARETGLRQQIDELKAANEVLAVSLKEQKNELTSVKEKLRGSEEALASEKERHSATQSQLDDVAIQLHEAVAVRDALNQEKESLAASMAQLTAQLELEEASASSASTVALQERIAVLETEGANSAEQIQVLTTTRDNLLQRNDELQNSVEQLNADLSKLAEKEEAEENALTRRVDELTKTNEDLKKSLESQKEEFDALLRAANRGEALTAPSASGGAEALQGVVKDLKKTLGRALGREVDFQEQLSDLLAEHTEAMLEMNTRMAKASGEIAAARGLLAELDDLRTQVQSLRKQGKALEDELAQRATHISTLNQDNASWRKEARELRDLLETEQLAQAKLRAFVESLQSRITNLESPTQEVATK